jgi:hypothetical protein
VDTLGLYQSLFVEVGAGLVLGMQLGSGFGSIRSTPSLIAFPDIIRKRRR